MLRTIVYMRKSSEDETEKQAESIPRQKRDIASYLERNALNDEMNRLDVREEDIHLEDVSAKKLGRKEFTKVVEKIKKGRGLYKVLLCTELTRLSRNPIDNGTVVSLMDDREEKNDRYLEQVRTLDQTFRANPTDKFTLSLFLSVAKFENDMRAKNTSSGMQNRKSQGATTNRAPCGYINCGDKKGKKWVEPDGENFHRVKRLWELYSTGNYTVADIEREANVAGVTILNSDNTRTPPSRSVYHSMFRNRYYLGEVQILDQQTEKSTWGKGDHIPMVSAELFDVVQVIQQKGGYIHTRVNKTLPYEVILQGVLLCGKTNRAMTFEEKIRYTCGDCKHRFAGNRLKNSIDIICPACSRALNKKDIESPYHTKFYTAPTGSKHTFLLDGVEKKDVRSVATDYIERGIDKELASLSISDALYEVLKKRLYTLWLEKRSDREKRIKEYSKEIDRLDVERRKLEERIAKELSTMDESTREDLDYSIKKNREDVKEKERCMSELREQLGEEFEQAWQLLYTMFEAKTIFSIPENGNFEPKRNLLLSMVSNIIFLDGKIIMKWKSPFDMLVTGKLTKQKSQVDPEISDGIVEWLPGADSNRRPIG